MIGNRGQFQPLDVEPVIARRGPTVSSWATGRHMPAPYKDVDGRWRCHDCEMKLTRYKDPHREGYRLRHHPEGRR